MKNGKQKSETHWQRSDRLPLVIASVLFLAVLTVCVLYIQRTTVPLERLEIGPANDPARWRFTLTDGTELQPQDGRLPVDGPDTVVICETEVSGDVREFPLIVVTSKSSDCVFFIDGQLIYSPSGRYRDGTFSDDPFSTASGQFGLPALGDGKRLTMVVQFQGEENRLSRMPKLTFYSTPTYYYSQHTSSAAKDALPAGIYFAVAIFLMALFLFGLWKQRSDPGLIPLAFCALSMAFQHTASYSYGVMELLQSPTVTWFCTLLPQMAMSWTLWYRLSRKLRLTFLPLPGLITIATLTLLFLGLDNMTWVGYMNAVSMWIMPGLILITLIAAAVDAAKGNDMLRRFFAYLACALPVVGAVWGVSALGGGKLDQTMRAAISTMTGPNHSFHAIFDQFCILLLILCFVQAILELIESMVRQETELQAIALREKYATENLEIMRQSQDETQRQRHELRHHLTLLERMLSQEQEERAADYIHTLLAEANMLPIDSYSDNMVVNAIAGFYLNTAKAEGIRVETEIKVKASLPLKDEELCILLTNLLENALEACRAMKQEQERFISLAIFSDGEHLHITCENSAEIQAAIPSEGIIPTSKADAKNHGYGIPAMRRIVEKHYGSMNTAHGDGRFTVKITL